MTNAQIIGNYMLENNLDPKKIVLHTYAEWKRFGYQVKKGEKSEHKITIWKKSTKKKKEETDENKDTEQTTTEETKKKSSGFFLTTASFFTQEQVERIENKND